MFGKRYPSSPRANLRREKNRRSVTQSKRDWRRFECLEARQLLTVVADVQAPRIDYASINDGVQISPGNSTFTFHFDQTLDDSVLDASDVSLIGDDSGVIEPSSFVYDAGDNGLTIAYPELAEEDYQLTLTSGTEAFVDLTGQPLDGENVNGPIPQNVSGDGIEGGDFSVRFQVDTFNFDLASPLLRLGPSGSLLRGGNAHSFIDGDTSVQIVNIGAGQTLAAFLASESTLQGSLEIKDPSGSVISTANASDVGQAVIVDAFPTTTPGPYTLTVSGQNGTKGLFDLRVIVNGALESESATGTSNDTSATAIDLDPQFLTAHGSIKRAGISGASPGKIEELLFDDFPDRFISASRWRGRPVTASGAATNEPSEPYSANLDLGGVLATHVIDLSGISDTRLSFWYQQSAYPTAEESLWVEYINQAGLWVAIEKIPGIGVAMTDFQKVELNFPAEAHHSKFQFRIRSVRGGTTDDWYVDDVRLTGKVHEDPSHGGWYKLSLDDGESLSVGIDNVDAEVSVYEADGTTLIAVSEQDGDSRLIQHFVDGTTDGTPDTYFIHLSNPGNNFGLAAVKGAGLDELIMVDSRTLPQRLGPTQAILGNIPSRYDGDVYSLDLVEGDEVTIDLNATGFIDLEPVNLIDPVLQIFVPVGRSETTDSVLGDESVTFTAEHSGEYLVRVRSEYTHRPGTEGYNEGDYALTITGNTPVVDALSVTNISPYDGSEQNFIQPTVTVDFSVPLLMSSIQPGDLRINGAPANSFTIAGPSQIVFDIDGLADSDGTYEIELAAGSILGLSQQELTTFQSTFLVDTTGPTVISTSIAEGEAFRPGNLTYVMEFSEALWGTAVDRADMRLAKDGGGFNSLPDTLTLSRDRTTIVAEFSGLDEGLYHVSFLSNFSTRDSRGNYLDGDNDGTPGGNHVLDFAVDVESSQFPTSITIAPAAALIYHSSVDASIHNADVDQHTIEIEAGQFITVVMNPDSNLVGSIELTGPDGSSLGSATGSQAGETVAIQSLTTPVMGVYRITVTSADDSIGNYNASVLFGAGYESEAFAASDDDSPNNDTPENADSLTPSAQSPLVGTTRYAAIGASDGNDDFYSFTATADDDVTIAVAMHAGSIDAVELADPSGNVLATGIVDAESDNHYLHSFPVPATGTYTVRVKGNASTYGLAVLVGADIDSINSLSGDRLTAQELNGARKVYGQLETRPQTLLIDFSDEAGNPDLEGFIASGLWHVTDQHGGTPKNHSIPHFAYFGDDVTGTYDQGHVSGYLTSPPIGLSDDNPALSFRYRMETESDTSVDQVFVRASTDGGETWNIVTEKGLGSKRLYNTQTFWVYRHFDLSSYAGETILLRFEFDSINDIDNNFLGWQVDDVTVTGARDGVDRYSFAAEGGDVLVIETTTPFDAIGQPDNNLNPRIELYDQAGQWIASDDDGAVDGRNSRMEFTVPAGLGGRLIVAVTGEGAGNYTLLINDSTSDVIPPTVTSHLIQAGMTQRSYIDRLEFSFSEETNLQSLIDSGEITAAFTLSNLGIDVANVDRAALAVTADQFQYSVDAVSGASMLKWSLDSFGGAKQSLDDGLYQYVLDSTKIEDLSGNPLNGGGDDAGPDNYTGQFHRLFGDVNGDSGVDIADMTLVNSALGSRPGFPKWNPEFDIDRDNWISVRDRIAIARNRRNEILDGATNSFGLLESVARFDVNGSDVVSALDALLIINHLARQQTKGVSESDLLGGYSEFDHLDVSRDQKVSALDALQVINQLYRLTNSNGEVGSSGSGTANNASITFNWIGRMAIDSLEHDDDSDGDLLTLLADDQLGLIEKI